MKVIEHIKKSKNTRFSYEIIPPLRGKGIQVITDMVKDLEKFNPPFIDVTSHSSSVSTYGNGKQVLKRKRPGTISICGIIQNRFKIDTVAHLVCNGFTKEETEDALIELNYLGIDNILAVRGDELRQSKKLEKDNIYNKYASDLVEQIQKMNNGKYLEDLVDPSKTDFCVGVGGYPEKHFEALSMKSDMEKLKYKVDCGADYIVTQMFFDNKHYFKFVEQCNKIGIKIPIIPGIKILSLERHLEALPKHFYLNLPKELIKSVEGKSKSEIRNSGIDWATSQIQELIDRGVPCIHLYIMSSAKSATKVVSNFI